MGSQPSDYQATLANFQCRTEVRAQAWSQADLGVRPGPATPKQVIPHSEPQFPLLSWEHSLLGAFGLHATSPQPQLFKGCHEDEKK